MEKELKLQIENHLRARKKNLGERNVSEADYLTGAMQMYLLLKPESESDGAWAPPSWVFGIMRGDEIA